MKKRRKRISEMTPRERRLFLVDNLNRKASVELCRRVLRQVEREYNEIKDLYDRAVKFRGTTST